jgi:bilirubin oxidase
MTRLNVYNGLSGFYLLRKKSLDKPELEGIPFPPMGALPKTTLSTHLRELPIVMQDRAFFDTGKLYYPVNDIPREATLPDGPYNPYAVPEFFPTLPDDPEVSAAVMVVNGKSWPKVEVARSNYRLRLLNGFNSRTVILSFR